MNPQKRSKLSPQNLLFSGGLLLLGLVIGLTFLTYLLINRGRQAMRYPGAVLIDDHSFYTPTFIFWNGEYRSGDSLADISHWYLTELDLNRLDRWVGDDCVLLNRLHQQLSIEHELGVLICQTPTGQTIHLTRSMAIRSLRTEYNNLPSIEMTNGY